MDTLTGFELGNLVLGKVIPNKTGNHDEKIVQVSPVALAAGAVARGPPACHVDGMHVQSQQGVLGAPVAPWHQLAPDAEQVAGDAGHV